jgi:hypothetical protein
MATPSPSFGAQLGATPPSAPAALSLHQPLVHAPSVLQLVVDPGEPQVDPLQTPLAQTSFPPAGVHVPVKYGLIPIVINSQHASLLEPQLNPLV